MPIFMHVPLVNLPVLATGAGANENYATTFVKRTRINLD